MAESVAQLTAGTVIGGTYEAVHQIGRGGMGEVWAAKHLRLPKQVAIKVLHLRGQALSEDALARFFREAEIASRLAHPNIVEVHDFNKLPSGDPYIVLELLEGEPLSRRLKRGVLSFEEARGVVRQVGSALQAAHHHGVVHRDLKPDNIFLLPSPLGGLRVKVLDFGISKIQDSNTVQTQEAVLVGTPQYMSPEQATGSNKDVGPQSDVFALAAIIYEALTGTAAFKGESVAQLVFRVAYEKHAPLGPQVAPDVPPSAVAAVERALNKDRAQRTPDIAAFVSDFTGEPITLAPSAGIPPAPQLALVATPSMDVSNSLALGDTAAPSGAHQSMKPATPPPVVSQLVTPAAAQPLPPVAAPSLGVSSASGTRAPASSSTTAASSGFRFSAVWVSAALLVGVGGILALRSGRPPPDVMAEDDGGPRGKPPVVLPRKREPFPEPPKVEPQPKPSPAEEVKPAADPPELKAGGAASEPPPKKSEPKGGKPNPPPATGSAEADAEDFTAAPKPRSFYSDKAQARVDELRALANPPGGKAPEFDTLIRRYGMMTDEVKDRRAIEEMTAIVAVAMCRNSDLRWKDYFSKLDNGPWRRRVRFACH